MAGGGSLPPAFDLPRRPHANPSRLAMLRIEPGHFTPTPLASPSSMPAQADHPPLSRPVQAIPTFRTIPCLTASFRLTMSTLTSPLRLT